MTEVKTRSGIFYGWWVIIACALIAVLASTGRYSFTMFLPILLDDLGWTRAMLGFGLTLHMWVYSIMAIIAGILVDRFGARVIMAVGGMFILLGLVLTSTMSALWEFYLFYGVILALGVAMTLSVPAQATARKWFTRRAGLAIAFASGGISIGIGVVALVAPVLIGTYGWRRGWIYLGLSIGIVIVLLAGIIIRKDPESMGLLPDGGSAQSGATPVEGQNPSPIIEEVWTLREALATRSYWCILFGYGLVGINYVGIIGHMAAWGVDIAKASQIPLEEGMDLIKMSIFLLALVSVIGGFIGGPLSDRIGRKPVFSISLFLAAVMSLYAMVVNSLTEVLIVGVLSGLFMGLSVPLWSAYLGDIFGRASLATLFGLLTFTLGILGGSGSVIFGWIFDLTGSYKWAWFLAAVTTFIIIVLILLTREEKKRVGR
jgi:MFS family permease